MLAALAGATGRAGAALPALPAMAAPAAGAAPDALRDGARDRADALDLLRRMAEPLLGAMSRGRLQRDWRPELSPSWDGRNPKVAYMEGFARLLDGIAPWLALRDDGSAEARWRARLRDQALASLAHAVDPASPDYLLWRSEGQPLVDSAFLTSALLRAPAALWAPLDRTTQRRLIEEIVALRRVSPPYQNWILFAAMNEAFLLSVGERWDPMRVELSLRTLARWYVGDGWYGDGERFHFDYYNSYVIHPMQVQILATLARAAPALALRPAGELARAVRRAQRYAEHLERMIAPDGSFAAIGRSLTYRTAVHQPLALLAWRGELPASLPAGQVRAATMAAQRRVFAAPDNFDAGGFLTIGFAGHQPALGDAYSNAGSMYIAAESLLALGLPADAAYWTAPPAPWTMRRAFAGAPFRKDYYVTY
ncbi:hypothetical protein EV292_10914 [Sphingomonas sp. BK235]|nr:hypothetical protein EV292_10914 [Sphingomonas sp. BK235]